MWLVYTRTGSAIAQRVPLLEHSKGLSGRFGPVEEYKGESFRLNDTQSNSVQEGSMFNWGEKDRKKEIKDQPHGGQYAI